MKPWPQIFRPISITSLLHIGWEMVLVVAYKCRVKQAQTFSLSMDSMGGAGYDGRSCSPVDGDVIHHSRVTLNMLVMLQSLKAPYWRVERLFGRRCVCIDSWSLFSNEHRIDRG